MKKTSYWKRFTHTHSVYIQKNISPARDAFIVCCLQFVVVQQGVIWPIEASSPKVVCWQDWLCDLDVALASLHSFGGAGVNPAMGWAWKFQILQALGANTCQSWRRVFSIQNGHIGACCRNLSMWIANHSWILGELSCFFPSNPCPQLGSPPSESIVDSGWN